MFLSISKKIGDLTFEMTLVYVVRQLWVNIELRCTEPRI